MGMLSRFKGRSSQVDGAAHETSGTGRNPPLPDQDMEKMDDSPAHIWNTKVISMILIVSLGKLNPGLNFLFWRLAHKDL